MFYGPVQSIAPSSPVWVFAGPPAQVTTTAVHPRVVAAASAALGFAPGSNEGYADLGLCYRLSSGGITLNFYGGNFTQHGFSAARLPVHGDRGRGAACRQLPGRPVRAELEQQDDLNNNYVNGYAQVTQ